MENRLQISIAIADADRTQARLRSLETGMDRLEGAATDAERGVDRLGDGLRRGERGAERYGRAAQTATQRTSGLASAAASATARVAQLGAAAFGAAASFATIGAVKIAASFESEFAKVRTLLDETSFAVGGLRENLQGLQTGLLELRAKSGDTFENLTKGMFDLVSAGVAAGDSLRVLNDANTLAKAGVTDTAVAVDGLTTVFNAYGVEASRSEAIAAKFFTTQKFGKTTVEELARGLGQVAPLAANLGVELNELFAAQAAATSQGIRQSEAYTGLKAALTNVIKPSKDAADEAARLGVGFDAASLKAKGLTQFLADIEASAGFTDESFQRLFGSAEALNTILAITGGGAEVYAKTLRALGDEAQSVSVLQDAFAAVAEGNQERFSRLSGTISALAVAIGTGLAPAVGDITERFTNFLQGADFGARLEGLTSDIANIVGVLAANWGLVEKGATAAFTAASLYVGLNVAQSVASVLNLAGAWRTVDKAAKGAAASVALLGAASGASGLRGLLAGLTGLAGAVGRSVLSLTALRGAIAAVGVVIASIPLAGWIIAGVTALVTFRKEIAQAVAGTRDVGLAVEAAGNVMARAFEPVTKAVRGVIDWIKGIGTAVAEVAQEIADRTPALVEYFNLLNRFSNPVSIAGGVGRAILDRFRGAVTEEVDRIETTRFVAADNDNRRLADNAFNSAIGVAPGLSDEIAGLSNEYRTLTQAVNGYAQAAAGATAATTAASRAANDNQRSIGSVERELRAQLALAERLRDAAGQGEIAFDLAVDSAALDQAAEEWVRKAQEAGETFSLATARGLLEQKRIAEETGAALLRNAREFADEVEGRFQGFIDRGFSDFQSTDLTALTATQRTEALASVDKTTQELLKALNAVRPILSEDQIADLADAATDAGDYWRNAIVSAGEEAGRRMAERVAGEIQFTLNDLIFGGASFGDVLKRAGQDLANNVLIGPLSDVLAGAKDADGNPIKLGDAVKRQVDGVKDGFGKVFGSVSDGLTKLGQTVGAAFSAAAAGFAGFGIGQTASDLFGLEQGGTGRRTLTGATTGASIGFVAGGPIGAAIGAVVGALAGAISGLVGNKTSFASVDLASGQVIRLQDSKKDSRNEIRDTAFASFLPDVDALRAAVGASFKEGVAIGIAENGDRIRAFVEDSATNAILATGQDRASGDTDAAVRDALKFALQRAFVGANDVLAGLASDLLDTTRPINDIVSVLNAVREASASGTDALAKFALAAANAGQSGDEIVAGVNSLREVFDLVAPELSSVAASIKRIDDAIGPAVQNLVALGQSIDEIAAVEQQAGRAVGVDFLKRIQSELDRAQVPALADFKELLDRLGADLTDARQLADRNFITPDEFRLVQQNVAVQQARFFEGLDQDALNQLGDYLGLIRENGGEAQVVLLQFNQELDRTVDSLTGGLTALRDEANRFLAAATASQNLSQDIRRRLSNETGLTQLATFRGDLQGILATVQAGALPGGDRQAALNAAERAPDVAQQFIALAERRFGASAGLGAARDFVTDILDRIGGAAEGIGNDTLSAIEAANQQVALLGDVRDLLSRPDPALDKLQSILEQGQIQSQTLRDLLDQYIALSYEQPANFTPGQVQSAAAAQIIIPSDLRITNTVTTDSPSTALAIAAAAQEARAAADDAQEAREEQRRILSEMQEAILKLDSTLRASNASNAA